MREYKLYSRTRDLVQYAFIHIVVVRHLLLSVTMLIGSFLLPQFLRDLAMETLCVHVVFVIFFA